ncbi:hypothetical protein [Nostoc sp.]|uniref:hypothetical protein n=1 Tax=Nostoc sp. TaxID=1180 RepID=UPI002FF9B573
MKIFNLRSLCVKICKGAMSTTGYSASHCKSMLGFGDRSFTNSHHNYFCKNFYSASLPSE